MATAVRRVRTNEVAGFRELRLRALADAPRAFASTFGEESQLLPRAWEERVARSAEGNLSANFVAEADDGALVGLVGAYRPESGGDEVELVSMWVAPGARRSGLGAELVRAVVDWAAGAGAHRVSLWVTRGNDRAIDLYTRMGFAVVPGTQPLPSHPCHEELRMVRVLAAPAS